MRHADTSATLQARRVAVVGASAGIGKSFAEQAAEAGARLVIGARRVEVLAEVAREGRVAVPIPLDVTDDESIRAYVSRATEILGEIDLLLCTVGWAEMKPLLTTDRASWERTVATNVIGLSHLLTTALPSLSDIGVLAVLSSETAAVPRHGLVPYSASKAALEAMLKGMRVEHPGTRVSCVAIGGTFPTGFADAFDQEQTVTSMQNWRDYGLLQQEFMTPDDVAGVLVDVYGTALRHPGVCVDEIHLRSPSPVLGSASTTTSTPAS